MMKEKRPLPPFTSAMTKAEAIAALIWLPVHLWLLPLVGVMLVEKGLLDAMQVNFLSYSLGALYMVALLRKYLRRDFDPFCDAPFLMISEVFFSYAFMLLMNLAVAYVLLFFMPAVENPNNAAVLDMTELGYGPAAAMTIFLAPLVEEPVFRGALFGFTRRYNRTAAYVLSVLVFSLYHVWPYALMDGSMWIYIIQYIPASYILCRCYERSNSIWGSIFLHMLINGVSLTALNELGKML